MLGGALGLTPGSELKDYSGQAEGPYGMPVVKARSAIGRSSALPAVLLV